MEKKELINQVRLARSSHVAWRANAQALVCGFDVDQQKVPVLHTATHLGQWYYGQGQILSQIPEYQAVEPSLILVHQQYMQVYKLMFGKVRRTFFKSKEKIKEENCAKAKEKMMELTGISDTLTESLLHLERRIIDMEEAELSRLM